MKPGRFSTDITLGGVDEIPEIWLAARTGSGARAIKPRTAVNELG
jgi:hypothetical protein